ncbi:GHKL domain-containing protein [Sphingobacterium sp. E70]|uniref:GHKL domain-containing protein n=1 Tax=Sphingobacterium sp. E70 TaxID=2853439 RepID=UPI00359C2E06
MQLVTVNRRSPYCTTDAHLFCGKCLQTCGSTSEPKGKISVNCAEKDGYFQFHIKNSYQTYPLQASTRHSGIGLENVKKRLELQYENQYSLTIDKQDDSFCIDLTINLNC